MQNRQISKAFGIVLRKRRLALRLSQEKLSEKADLHPTHVSLIERFQRNPSLNVAASLAKTLGVKLRFITQRLDPLPLNPSGSIITLA
jgi:transcriptional regulator with XRE-family HTH domain